MCLTDLGLLLPNALPVLVGGLEANGVLVDEMVVLAQRTALHVRVGAVTRELHLNLSFDVEYWSHQALSYSGAIRQEEAVVTTDLVADLLSTLVHSVVTDQDVVQLKVIAKRHTVPTLAFITERK